jgi:putative tricarboxylic transport membrane protein
VLGDRAEDAFRQALLGSGGDLSVFFSNALVSTLMVLALLLLFWGPLGDLIGKVLRRGQLAPRPAE